MTEGTTAETVDGMSLAKIDRIIKALRYERFRWTPVRRVNIPKPPARPAPWAYRHGRTRSARGYPDDLDAYYGRSFPTVPTAFGPVGVATPP